MRSAATRPMLTSSADGAAQPRITSSSCVGSNGWRSSSARPGVGREVGRRERARPVARLEERRARAVDDVDRFVRSSRSRSRAARAARRMRWPRRSACDRRHAAATRRDRGRSRRRAITRATSAWCLASARASSAVMTPGRHGARRERVGRRIRRQAAVELAFLDRRAHLRLDRLRGHRRRRARARSSATGSSSSRPMNMPAVSRSRVADGAIRSCATSWPSWSDGTSYGRPSGNTMRRASAATNAVREIGDHALERVLRLEHRVPDRPVHERRVGRLPALAPRSACSVAEHRYMQRQDVAEPRRQLLLALQLAAERAHRHVGEERERRREARELLVVAARLRRDVARRRARSASR